MPKGAAITSRLLLLVALLACSAFAAGCASGKIERALPRMDSTRASYMGTWFTFGPTWYSLYSVLPGNVPLQCAGISLEDHLGLAVRNCAGESNQQVLEIAERLHVAQASIEAAFDGQLAFVDNEYTLVPPGAKYIGRSTRLLRLRRLKLAIAVRHDPAKARHSEVEAVRSSSHEVYHMAMTSQRSQGKGFDWPEEMRATLFGVCIEQQTFGSIEPDALDPANYSDPSAFEGQAEAYRSTTDALRAARTLAAIAGEDQAIATPAEVSELMTLCRGLTHKAVEQASHPRR